MKEISQLQSQLDYLFKQVSALPDNNLELKSHWARYLCVLVSGFLENCIRLIFTEIARKQASPNIANFVAEQIDDFQNPKMEKILDLIRKFNSTWEINIRVATTGELKDAVDSIVQNRHQIAHGRNVGVSYVTVAKYYQNVIKVIEVIEQECK